MKRLEIVFKQSAANDIGSLYEWVATASNDPVAADRFIQRIYKACAKISDFPKGGRERNDLLPGLRTIAFERKAVITYIEKNDTIEITNIFYGGRDFEAMYRDSDSPRNFE